MAVIDTGTNTVTGLFDWGGFGAPYGLAVSPDGTYPWVAEYDNAGVKVLLTADGSVVDTIGVGSSPTDVVFSPDGSTAYVSDRTGVQVISTADRSITSTVSLGTTQDRPFWMAVNSTGTALYATQDFVDSVAVIDTAASNTPPGNGGRGGDGGAATTQYSSVATGGNGGNAVDGTGGSGGDGASETSGSQTSLGIGGNLGEPSGAGGEGGQGGVAFAPPD